MGKPAAATLALATLLALALTGLPASSRAQDGQHTVNLSAGCNMVTLTFPTGSPTSTLADFVSPSTALQAVWRLDNVTRTFQAFMPQAPQASDLTSLNLLDAVFICVDAAATVSLPVVSPDPAGPPISVSLSAGCNAVGLSFAEGTNPSEVGNAVSPAGALQSIWRLDNATHGFQAYVSAAPQASDLTSLNFLDAVFACTGGPATLSMPAVTEPTAVMPPAPPPGDGAATIQYVMEAAVPQVVDLPQGFVAVDENFMTSDDTPGMPPGGLYMYGIAYGNALGIIDFTPSTLFFVVLEVALFDTTEHARSFMREQTEMSADERKALLQPRFGGSYGIEIGSLTVQEVEPLAGIGDEADFIRVRMQIRTVGTDEMFLPVSEDLYTIRRDRVVAQVTADWTPGPPGPKFITENLAKKMDAGIQQALPQLLAAAP